LNRNVDRDEPPATLDGRVQVATIISADLAPWSEALEPGKTVIAGGSSASLIR
jgi:hypothetical protein